MGVATTACRQVTTLETPNPPPRRRFTMTWQTPTACDFRFGFEITMYVAAR